MINAIVTSLSRENLLVSPTAAVELPGLVGKKVRYWKGEKVYPGIVERVEDPFLVIRFEEFPTGIGQGQMVEILEGPEDEEQQ
jgi:hypothetical protein